MSNIYAALTIYFKDECDCEEIASNIGVKTHRVLSKVNAKVNPLTNEKNDGYCAYRTNEMETQSTEGAVEALNRMFEGKVDLINKLKQQNNGYVSVKVVIELDNDTMPEITVSNKELKFITSLDANFNVNLYEK